MSWTFWYLAIGVWLFAVDLAFNTGHMNQIAETTAEKHGVRWLAPAGFVLAVFVAAVMNILLWPLIVARAVTRRDQ